jgi:uncharacterized protein YdhG (YjbR/CyaY superfamily)
MKKAVKPANKPGGKRPRPPTFSPEERAAMREYVREKKAAARRSGPADEEPEVLAKIAAMPKADRELAARVHAIVRASAPVLAPKLWYGMPAYARDGKVVCFFQDAGKFKSRYATLGFSDRAALDDGDMWPTAFALTRLTAAGEARIAGLVRKAAR